MAILFLRSMSYKDETVCLGKENVFEFEIVDNTDWMDNEFKKLDNTDWMDNEGWMDTSGDLRSHPWDSTGLWIEYFLMSGKPIRWKSNKLWISNRLRNRAVGATNGNRMNRNILKLVHWNMGSKRWERKKTEIDALILDKSPDLLYTSEANLMKMLPNFDRQIEGYRLYLPDTMEKHNYACLVLLVKEGVEVAVHHELMHEDVASIWVSVRNGSKGVLKIGGVYREHRMLLKPKPNLSKSDQAQLERWN